jgi:hypothetical protein
MTEERPDTAQEPYDEAAIAVLRGLEPLRRRSRLTITSERECAIVGDAMIALHDLLDLRPEIGALTLTTANGWVHIARDEPAPETDQADAALARLFRADPAITAVTVPPVFARPARVATPDDPYLSPHGKAMAAIESALKEGKMSIEDANAATRRLATEPDPAP